MILAKLEAITFRNLAGHLNCEPGLNILFGDNGQGKTNWLEAIFLLGGTKSFRTNHLQEVIQHSAETAILRGTVRHGTLEKELQAQFQGSTKSFYVNGKREATVKYLGNLDVFAFTHDELAIIRGEPGERRRFMDRGVAMLNPAYIKTLNEYNRCLKQKTALLKKAQESEEPRSFIPLIETWNEQIIQLGASIHQARFDYIERLSRALNPQLFGQETITIRYKSSLEQHGDLADYPALLRARLATRLPNEMALGYSLVGPHRDDLQIALDGHEVQRFGSAGQQRSALLILVLAQISLYNSVFEDYPIFILDDIDAELDLGRIRTLLNHLDGKTQTFISTSKQTIKHWYSGPAAYRRVVAGRITESQPVGVEREDLPEAVNEPLVVAAPETLPEPVQGETKPDQQENNQIDPHQAPF